MDCLLLAKEIPSRGPNSHWDESGLNEITVCKSPINVLLGAADGWDEMHVANGERDQYKRRERNPSRIMVEEIGLCGMSRQVEIGNAKSRGAYLHRE